MLKFTAQENSFVNFHVKITETGKQILEKITRNASVTMQETVSLFRKDVSTIGKTVKRLKELGKIERIGSDKSGKWKVMS